MDSAPASLLAASIPAEPSRPARGALLPQFGFRFAFAYFLLNTRGFHWVNEQPFNR